jgi:hypothetical protein
MGLGAVFLGELIALKRSGTINGFTKVIEIGAQQLANSFLRAHTALDELYRLFDRPRPYLGEPQDVSHAGGPEIQPDSAPSSRQFWETLGFVYHSIEFAGHRDSIALDLNRDQVGLDLRGAFHIAVNTGTTEHVANQDNAFRVIHDLVCRGGIMMHELPAGGMMNHGLVNYNPKFFWFLCRENEYEVLSLRTYSYGSNPVPQNIIDSNLQFGGKETDIGAVKVQDFAIRAALRKRNDRPFVTPLDVPPEVMPQRRPPEP